MIQRSQPPSRKLKLGDLPELTIVLANRSSAVKPSKMIADANDKEDNLDQADVMFRDGN